jgi:heterodisulfide reductase subunit B
MALFDVKLQEMENASCCPEPVAMQSLNVDAWLTLGARNLAIAEKMGLDVLTICSGCYETLKTVEVLLKKDKEKFDYVNQLLSEINYEYKGTSKVLHFVELFSQPDWLEKLSEKLVRPLDDFSFAVHYGCHLIRPSEIMQFDDPERPEKIDLILDTLKANTIDYATKLECCGYCARLQDEIGEELVEKKMVELACLDLDVDALIAVCPACISQYDKKERLLSRKSEFDLDIPVLYLPEIMAIALGIDVDKLDLRRRSIRPTKLIERLKT